MIVPGRNKINCKNRWLKTQQPKTIKLLWTGKEDETLKNLVLNDTSKNWDDITLQFNQCFSGRERTKNQCRIRWSNVLNPEINK